MEAYRTSYSDMLEVNQVASAKFRKTGKLDVFLAGTFAPWSSRHTLVTRAPGGHGEPRETGQERHHVNRRPAAQCFR